MYNILIGGAAGDGIETTASVLEKTLKQMGYHVFAMRDFMSRVRGGHNFVRISFGNTPIDRHKTSLDGIIAINEESYELHISDLKDDGFIIAEPKLELKHKNLLSLPFGELAKEAGNPRAAGSVVIGGILALFGLDLKKAEDVFRGQFAEHILEANLNSLRLGYQKFKPQYSLEDPQDMSHHMQLTGAEAMSIGALAGNMRFYSAYPMSPATTLLTYFSRVEEKSNIVVEQAEDEIAAINMAIGASTGGARAMAGTSGGGFSLMVEALGFAGIAEVPIVLANVQRPGPATGLPTRTEQSDLRFMISASQGEFPRMIISPQTHEDLYHQTHRAFDLAEKYQIPVILLSDQYLADSSAMVPLEHMEDHTAYEVKQLQQNEKISVDEHGVYKRYQYADTGISPLYHFGESDYLVRIDSDEHTEYGVLTESADVRVKMVDKRAQKLDLLKEELIEPKFVGNENPDVLLTGFGSTYTALRDAVETLNKQGNRSYAALSFGDVYPLPTKLLKEYSAKADNIWSVEQNSTGQLAGLIRETTLINCQPGFLKYDGRQMTAEEIITAVETL